MLNFSRRIILLFSIVIEEIEFTPRMMSRWHHKSMTWINQSMFCVKRCNSTSVISSIITKCWPIGCIEKILGLSRFILIAICFETINVFVLNLVVSWSRHTSSISRFDGNIGWIRIMIHCILKVASLVEVSTCLSFC